jgi:hypothetical protein
MPLMEAGLNACAQALIAAKAAAGKGCTRSSKQAPKRGKR